MTITEYTRYDGDEIIALYSEVGWSAYTADPEALRKGFENSLTVLAAYIDGRLAGILRAVGDGQTIVYVQDILVRPSCRRRGVGSSLLRQLLDRYSHVRQISLVTDNTPETAAFYEALGFRDLTDVGCRGYIRFKTAE